MGVYAVVDKKLDIERRFENDKAAANTADGKKGNSVSFYDDVKN